MPDSPTEPGGMRDAELGEVTLRQLGEGPTAPVRRRHPSGLRTLFMAEMWERFSFYGMKALLVLYLIKSSGEGGLEWSKEHAGTLMGWYAGLVYLTPVIGGYLADRYLGTHRSLIAGGLIIASGHFTLMLDTIPTLFIGLSLVIIGTGLFKGNVSTMVGQMYVQGDPRRDAGFTIYYMGINLGAFLAPLVCGFLRTRFGWSWGFGAAGVGMVLGLVQYLIGRPRTLAGIGDPPLERASLRPVVVGLIVLAAAGALATALYAHDRFASLGSAYASFRSNTAVFAIVSLALAAAVTAGIVLFVFAQDPEDRGPVAVIFIMAFFVIFFWSAFEQAGTSMAFFAEERTDRTMPGWLAALGMKGELAADGARRIPAETFQSINPLFILVLAPIFASIWVRLAAVRREPSTPFKMGLGLILLGLGFLFMVGAASISDRGALAAPSWLVAALFVHTCGELCLSPVGLSLVTKLAPVRFASLLMGVWFVANFVANLSAGLTAGKVESIAEKGFILPGWAGFYLLFVIAPVAAGTIVLLLVPLLRKMMGGRA